MSVYNTCMLTLYTSLLALSWEAPSEFNIDSYVRQSTVCWDKAMGFKDTN